MSAFSSFLVAGTSIGPWFPLALAKRGDDNLPSKAGYSQACDQFQANPQLQDAAESKLDGCYLGRHYYSNLTFSNQLGFSVYKMSFKNCKTLASFYINFL